MSRPAEPGIDPAIDFLAELPEQVVYLLNQMHRRCEASIAEAFEEAGLPLAIWRMLLALQRMQPCTMNAPARYTTLERTALTRVLDQMVKQDLALRTTPPEDRRQVLVTLTGPGLKAFEKGRRIVTQWNRRALEGMSSERLEILRETLNEFLHVMSRIRHSPRISSPSTIVREPTGDRKLEGPGRRGADSSRTSCHRHAATGTGPAMPSLRRDRAARATRDLPAALRV